MAVNPYICFNGNCASAVEFYAQVFSLEKPKMMCFGDMPAHPDFPMSDAMKKRVMHTSLELCGGTIMFSDSFDDNIQVGNNISVAILTQDEASTKTYFEGLKQDGKVIMELQETEWSKCYGMVVDKFGITWQLSMVVAH